MNNSSRGLVILNTGDGKGKTTAALGLLLRAWGHDMKVVMLQFIKSQDSVCGERRAAERMGVEIVAGGAGFTRRGKNADENKRLAMELWDRAREMINSGAYDMVILDEFTYPLQYGWLPLMEVLAVLRDRPAGIHVVITGRNAPQEIIDLADVVVEMRAIKHPLRKGVRAQAGIEF